MLSLKVNPNEFRAMIGYLREAQAIHEGVPLVHQTIAGLVLIQYLERWRSHQVLSWAQRRAEKEYRLNLPLPVARALHTEMQHSYLVGWQQLFLNKLDAAIINHRNPHADPHVIGELVRPA